MTANSRHCSVYLSRILVTQNITLYQLSSNFLDSVLIMIPSTWSSCVALILIVQVTINFNLVGGTLPLGTKSGVWPKPHKMSTTDEYFEVDPNNFQLKTTGIHADSCEVLNKAIARYNDVTFLDSSDCSRVGLKPGTKPPKQRTARSKTKTPTPSAPSESAKSLGQLTSVTIQILSKCESLKTLESDESYSITIKPENTVLVAENVWGALYGLETISQALYQTSDGEFRIKSVTIKDHPRFPYRGVYLDTSYHFIPVPVILSNMDAMFYNSLNVFHWYFTGNNSFSYQSKKFPELSGKGSFYPKQVYTPKEVKTVVEYGRLRGIRVIPELDTPAQTLSWAKGRPGLLTTCYDTNSGKPNGLFGPIDPSNQTNFDFVTALLNEVLTAFPDQYIQLGGDQVDFTCWSSSPRIKAFMAKNNIADYGKLEEYWMKKLIEMIGSNASYMVWQGVFDNGGRLNKNVIFEIWRGTTAEWKQELANITGNGYRAILSTPWILQNVTDTWQNFYAVEPLDFKGTDKQKSLVIGGEVEMPDENVDGSNLITRSWPRALAVAERLWSARNVRDAKKAQKRFEIQRCRMQKRGVRVEPVEGSSVCRCDYKLY